MSTSNVKVVDRVVSVEGLRKSYGERERLHGISFEVRAGEILGFLGTNGAGKTTTIEILEGYRPYNSGSVSVLGVDPAHATRAWRNRIGLVLQECELDPVYTVAETITIFSRYFRRATDVAATIEAVGLSSKANDRVGQLSGGQKRRLDVAVGLVGDPEILFLDEPTTGLDPIARREMWTMIEGLRDAGKTIFLTTHYMDEAEHLADRIIILRDGEIAAQGTAEELSATLGHQTAVTFDAVAGLDLDELAVVVDRPVAVHDAVVHFETSDVQHDLGALLRWARKRHVSLRNLQAVRPSLDDVFVQLAGDPTGDGREVEP
ncbi:MAG: ABC transporter ATP-binding protein [Acidimicrobiales bacterium]